MNLKIGILSSSNKVNVYLVDKEAQSMDLHQLDYFQIREENLNALFFKKEFITENFLSEIEEERKYYPIADARDYELNKEELSYHDIVNAYERLGTRWTLEHNLQTIENFGTLQSHFKNLWKGDRHGFFEELWYFLKTNLNTVNLRIVFHDVKENEENENVKPQLVESYLYGEKSPEFFQGTAAEKEILKSFSDKMQSHLQFNEYSAEKGQLAASVSLNGSPIVMMAQLPKLTSLQKSILMGLFNSLN